MPLPCSTETSTDWIPAGSDAAPQKPAVAQPPDQAAALYGPAPGKATVNEGPVEPKVNVRLDGVSALPGASVDRTRIVYCPAVGKLAAPNA